MNKLFCGWACVFSALIGGCSTTKNVVPAPVYLTATNQSYPSTYAEGDNVNVPITGATTSFLIEATHPPYNTDGGNSDPDFGGGSSDGDPVYYFTPGTFKLYDNGTTVLDAVREKQWWRPSGMDVSLNGGAPKNNIHYLRLYRKIAGVASWPQFLVLYQDGNLRLKPQRRGTEDNCFGSSVVIGPAAVAKRPIAEIASINFISASDTLKIIYKDGSTATLSVAGLDRNHAAVRINFNKASALPLLTFRSMFVKLGNSDNDSIAWQDTAGVKHEELILDFKKGESANWLFYRRERSTHNTSAPDIHIGT